MLGRITRFYTAFEKVIASMKFAVIIILAFAVALGIGTFQESWYGTEFAQKLIYKSWWFMAIQGLMFLSILLATLVRLPPRKSLYGFYAIHSGLLILYIGAFITYVSGVDGQMDLAPGTPSNRIVIPEDVLKIQFVSDSKTMVIPLPYSAYPKKMGDEYNGVKLLSYIPSADYETKFIKTDQPDNVKDHSGIYNITNDQFGENITLSLNPNSDFESQAKLGPLSVNYFPDTLFECFLKDSKSGYLIWNTKTGECYTPEEKGIEPQKTTKDNVFVVFQNNEGEWLKFFPDFSPFPLDDTLKKIEASDFRMFSKKIFEEKPNVFIFGKKVAYYKKRKNKWLGEELTDTKNAVELPWMGLKVKLVEYHDDMYPIQVPVFSKPIHDNGRLIHGDVSAVEIKMGKDNYWVKSDRPLVLRAGENEVRFQITQKELLLPYEINLDRFKMDTDPGTTVPASFESFVTLFDGRNPELGSPKHHIYMNHPLKYDGFTFYQASYYPVAENVYASVLSVNFDPGRFLKYLGAFLLIFGSAWHYFIRRKKGSKFFSREVKGRS